MRIFCGNLTWTLTDAELKAAFEPYGLVDKVEIPGDFETGRSKGFGFVVMPSEDEAHRAIAALDGSDLKGRAMRCSRAFDRPRRAR